MCVRHRFSGPFKKLEFHSDSRSLGLFGRLDHPVARFDPGLHPLETAILDERTRPDRPDGETTTFRVWSGRVLATAPPSP